MLLLTMGWFLAHTSLAMTPEQSDRSRRWIPEICKSRALKEHVPLTSKVQCDRACKHAYGNADANGSLAQLAANETPFKIWKFKKNRSLQLPSDRSGSNLQDKSPSGGKCTASLPAQGGEGLAWRSARSGLSASMCLSLPTFHYVLLPPDKAAPRQTKMVAMPTNTWSAMQNVKCPYRLWGHPWYSVLTSSVGR